MTSRVLRRLRDLQDVTFGSPADGDVPVYDSGTGRFVVEAAGAGAAASLSPSGDTTGATDTAAIQAAINTLYAAGGGLLQLGFAPNATPFWVTQFKMRAGVYVEGINPMSTVIKVPLGQTVNLHLCIVNAPNTDANFGLANLTLHGNNGFANIYPANWGTQASLFDGISWDNTPAGGLGSLAQPFNADRLLHIDNVMVVSFPRRGVDLANAASGVYNRLFVYWTGEHGINIGAYDTVWSDCICGFAGTSLTTPYATGAYAGFNIAQISAQMTNCKAWWPQTNFKNTNPITWDAPEGIGYQLRAGVSMIGDNLLAQDCGYGFASFGSTSSRIRGFAANCKIAATQWADANLDWDITVDYADNGSLVAPQYAFAGLHGANYPHSKIRVKYDSAMSFSNGPAYMDTNGTALAGSDVEIKCAGSQAVAYAATVTPTPYAAPVHYIGTLTGPITIAVPTNTSGASNFTGAQPYDGQTMELHLTQDGTGTRTVTFNAAYTISAAVPTTASTTTILVFRWDSAAAKWREIGRSTNV